MIRNAKFSIFNLACRQTGLQFSMNAAMTHCNIYCKLKIGNWDFFYLAIFALDRFLKWYAHNLSTGKVFSFLPGIHFGYFLNPSLFFFPAWPWIQWVALAVLVAVALFGIAQWLKQSLTPSTYPLIPIVLGGASNVFDRFAYGGVIDIIHIGGIATINLADILILVGIVALLLRINKSTN